MKSNKGFTLIELLIVAAIIGIFVAVVAAPSEKTETKEYGGLQTEESFKNPEDEFECIDGVLHWNDKPISEFTCKTVE